MTVNFTQVTYQGEDYRISVGGNGLFISVDRYADSPDGGRELTDVAFAQGDDACELVDYLDENGAKMLLGYLDSAGVDL